MCIFSGHVDHVARTSIFMREHQGWNCLVYSMTVATPSEVAMILPVRCADHREEDAVAPVSLEEYPDFFHDMAQLFNQPTKSRGGFAAIPLSSPETLKVQQVGNFEFSYVPGLDQFHRLDSRFQIPPVVIQQFPEYGEGHGFAVFKLTSNPGGGLRSIHPMAYTFRSAEPGTLVFPTAHYHGQQEERSYFDHALYVQVGGQITPQQLATSRGHWAPAAYPPSVCVNIEKTNQLVDSQLPVYRRRLLGYLTNGDTRIP